MALDAHVGVHLGKGITDSGEVTAKVQNHSLDAGCVLQEVHALSVRVVVDREGALDGLCKVPEDTDRTRPSSRPRIGSEPSAGPESILIHLHHLNVNMV